MSILIIVNPTSGRYSKSKIDKIEQILQSKFGGVSVYTTQSKGDAIAIAMKTDADIIIAAGGDGLINEVATGLLGRVGKLFTALPFGTANVFCNEYGINLNPIKATKNLLFNKVSNIPIGVIDDKIFLLMAGFGYDAEVVKKVEAKQYVIFKKLSYFLSGITTIMRPDRNMISISVAGHDYTVAHLVVAIVSSYAGRYKLGKIEAGRLNLFAIFPYARISLIKSILYILFGRGFSGSRMQVDYLKINNVSQCQLDGEYLNIDKSSVYISIYKDALKLVY